MREDDEDEEEKEVDGRRFRKLPDGEIVEILPDGTVAGEFAVGGQQFKSASADFESIRDAKRRLSPDELGEESESQLPQDAPPQETTLQDKMKDYLSSKGGDERSQALKKSITNYAFKGSLKDILDSVPKGTQLAGSHRIGTAHLMANLTKLESGKVDPLKQILEKRKPTTFTEHLNRVFGEQGGSDAKSMGMRSSMSAAKSRSGLSQRGRRGGGR
jgi:hypothetical protein